MPEGRWSDCTQHLFRKAHHCKIELVASMQRKDGWTFGICRNNRQLIFGEEEPEGLDEFR